mgnify:FL=1
MITDGAISYLAGWPDDTAMTRILSNVADKIGLETHAMQGGKRRREFGDLIINLDYEDGVIDLIRNKSKGRFL